MESQWRVLHPFSASTVIYAFLTTADDEIKLVIVPGVGYILFGRSLVRKAMTRLMGGKRLSCIP
ncbi:hypothetical protein H4582DRAFT_2095363, partial [Lactarius indigo]